MAKSPIIIDKSWDLQKSVSGSVQAYPPSGVQQESFRDDGIEIKRLLLCLELANDAGSKIAQSFLTPGQARILARRMERIANWMEGKGKHHGCAEPRPRRLAAPPPVKEVQLLRLGKAAEVLATSTEALRKRLQRAQKLGLDGVHRAHLEAGVLGIKMAGSWRVHVPDLVAGPTREAVKR